MNREQWTETFRELDDITDVVSSELREQLGRAPTPEEVGAGVQLAVSQNPELAARASEFLSRIVEALVTTLDAGASSIDAMLDEWQARGLPLVAFEWIAHGLERREQHARAQALRERLDARRVTSPTIGGE